MKKSMKWLAIVSILLAVIMCFSLVACGNKDKDSDTDTDVGTDTGVPEGSFTVTFKQEGQEDVVIVVEDGKTIDVPAPKAMAGYTVVWDQDLTGVAITANVTVTAEKTPVQNNINYVLNNGQNAASNPTHFTVEDEVTFANPTRNSYTFAGWYSDEACTTTITGIKKGTADAVVNVYAKWEPISYKIEYVTDGGTNPSTNPTTYNVESTGAIAGATKDKYEFLGWYLYSDFSGSVVDSLDDIASNGKDIKLYAKYDFAKYTITYVDATALIIKNDNPKEFTINDAITFVDPSRDGYTFEGWYSDAEYNNPIEGIAAGTEGNQTVYAKWSEIKYSITYKYNDETKLAQAADNITEYSISTGYEFKAPTAIAGYEFVGWFIEGKEDEDPIVGIASGDFEGPIVLVGVFDVEKFDITYEAGVGELPDGVTTEFTADDKVTLPTLEKAGYTFGGWFTEEACENAITEIDGAVVANDITVYAKWTAIEYTITYNVKDEGATHSNPAKYDKNSDVTFAPLVKEGYAFVGWYLDDKYQTKIESTEAFCENLTLYGKMLEISDEPTKTLTGADATIVRNGGNTAGNVQDFIMDGNCVGEDFYSGWSYTDWYNKQSVAGEILTITLNDPADVIGLSFYAKGNWVNLELNAYDANNNLLISKSYNVNDTSGFPEFVILDAESGTVLSGVKTITLTCNSDGKTYRVAEVEVVIKNPAYMPPVA